MFELRGWLLDLYPDPQGGVILWFLNQDESGEFRRLRLHQAFPITFYVAGSDQRLRELWHFLRTQPIPVKLARCQRRDLFQPEPITVLSVEVVQPAAQPTLFRQVYQAYPDLTYYDADLPLSLRHAAVYGTFPLARCCLSIDESQEIQELEVLDSPWELDAEIPPLQILSLEPNVDPFHASPTHLYIRSGRYSYCLDLEPRRALLVNLRTILERHDPDLLLTVWGDTWLLPRLLALSRRWRIPLPLNRDTNQEVMYRPERSYFTYGQIIYRGRQVHLFGRWHVDARNAMLFHDYGVEGILELARVTALPVQTVARVSPGSGISAMQMQTALRQGVLVPWHKQQAERPKSALEMFQSDQGGLVYQPLVGLHSDVAEIDFISMYPSIMARFNVSPETVGVERATAEIVPELGVIVDRRRPGLVPQTLRPLLEKRLEIKSRLVDLPPWNPRRKSYKARASAHKWLLVTCFGYLGYKNARFGRIEAHEAVTAYGREALLRAKEAAEELGFTVLHMYVDGLWVQKEGADSVADFQPLLEIIAERTSLPIALEGIYRWVAFLPSRQDERFPVANRYFGVFQDNSLKVRGIETRRRDTPLFIAEMQEEMLELLCKYPHASLLPQALPRLLSLLRRWLSKLNKGQIPLEKVLVSQKLSRSLQEYRRPSPVALAVAQLEAVGKEVKPGQCVRFVYTRGEPGVHAWDLPTQPNPATLDTQRYARLMLRAASTILQPLGIDETTLQDWLFSNAGYCVTPGSPSGVNIPRLPLLDERRQSKLQSGFISSPATQRYSFLTTPDAR